MTALWKVGDLFGCLVQTGDVFGHRGDLGVGHPTSNITHHLVGVVAAAAVAERLQLSLEVSGMLAADLRVLSGFVTGAGRTVARHTGRNATRLVATVVELVAQRCLFRIGGIDTSLLGGEPSGYVQDVLIAQHLGHRSHGGIDACAGLEVHQLLDDVGIALTRQTREGGNHAVTVSHVTTRTYAGSLRLARSGITARCVCGTKCTEQHCCNC